MSDLFCNDCRQTTSGRCWRHANFTVTVGAGQTAIVNGDFYPYEAAADALIQRLGWDESDKPEIIEALQAARRGEIPKQLAETPRP